MIHTHDKHHDLEEKGETNLQLVAITYTGDKSLVVKRDLNQRGGWMGPDKFQNGQTQLGLVPDWNNTETIVDDDQRRRVSSIEQMNNFEVSYDPETIAKELLEKNYLPTNAFYAGYDRYVRDVVFETLGLEEEGRVDDRDDEEAYRRQLREIAGVEGPDEDEYIEKNRIQEYDDRFKRDELTALCKELRDDSDELNLNASGRTEMIEFIASFEPEEVEDSYKSLD